MLSSLPRRNDKNLQGETKAYKMIVTTNCPSTTSTASNTFS